MRKTSGIAHMKVNMLFEQEIAVANYKTLIELNDAADHPEFDRILLRGLLIKISRDDQNMEFLLHDCIHNLICVFLTSCSNENS